MQSILFQDFAEPMAAERDQKVKGRGRRMLPADACFSARAAFFLGLTLVRAGFRLVRVGDRLSRVRAVRLSGGA